MIVKHENRIRALEALVPKTPVVPETAPVEDEGPIGDGLGVVNAIPAENLAADEV